MEAKNQTITNDSSTNIFLTGAILFANLDYSSLAEYALKAAIGGAIWMTFKIAADLISERRDRKRKKSE